MARAMEVIEQPETVGADQLELFVADLIDVNTKGDISSMEYPIFALSTKKDTEIYRFDNPDTGSWLEIIPSVKGRATIFDKDLMLYITSQLVEAQNRGKKTSRKVKIVAYDFLKATNRRTDGKSYAALSDVLARLRGTTFRSNIQEDGKVGKSRTGYVFGFIEDAVISEVNGRMTSIEVTIGERLAAAISRNEVLTYDRSYFKLRSPVARRLYELARKHCGNQAIWEISFEKLYRKFGTRASLREFRRMIRKAVEEQAIPGYEVDYEIAAPKLNAKEKLIIMPRQATLK
tara:strand:+ start:22280 stop:23146 length:867 start_codon:yes stop_codon:yes gene_type:complete